jgi:hypothetical protein
MSPMTSLNTSMPLGLFLAASGIASAATIR